MLVFKLFTNMTYDIILSKIEDPIDQIIGCCFRMIDHHCPIHSGHYFSFFSITDHQIHYWAKIVKAAFKAFVICLRIIGWDLEIYLASFSIICYNVFLWLNLYSHSLKKQWQIFSCPMVNANDIVIDITKNSIQLIKSMIILRVIYLLTYYCNSIFQSSVFNALTFG